MVKSTKFAIMLGGNLGDSEKIFARALEKLASGGCRELKMSRIHRSAAVDCVPGTPDFSDAAATGEWDGSPFALLRLCQEIEREAGRRRIIRAANRARSIWISFCSATRSSTRRS